MTSIFTSFIKEIFPAEPVSAHCDGPCGVYDPASARIAAEAVLSMTKKILALPAGAHDHATVNSMSRFIAIKEEQAHLAKTELLVLWTDYFKPAHLGKYPDLHEVFWNAAKLCSAVKVGVSLEDAEALMAAIENIHDIFWATKGRSVAYYTALLAILNAQRLKFECKVAFLAALRFLNWDFVDTEIKTAGWVDLLLWVLRLRKRFRVTGASMYPLLQPGEEVLVDLRAYQKETPAIGDIVVCLHPSKPGFRIIKRVAGLNPDASLNLKGENLFETTDYKSVPIDHILGKVTHRFGTNKSS